jgi:hypothetical protein
MIGLAANAPFLKEWFSEGRDWIFPISGMQAATLSRI